MKHLCDERSNSDDFDRQGYVVFQLIYYFLQNGIKKTLLYVSIVQRIHNECWSKKLITVLNLLGITISYDELERIDFALTNCLLKGLGEHRVPISNSINKSLSHGVMDNFDYIGDMKSGTGSSHDTILMVFQNQKETNDTVVFTQNKDDSKNKWSV